MEPWAALFLYNSKNRKNIKNKQCKYIHCNEIINI